MSCINCGKPLKGCICVNPLCVLSVIEDKDDYVDAIEQLESTITRLTAELADERRKSERVLDALASMCDQYLQQQDGTLFHDFMSAGETATEVLEDLGYLKSRGENYSWISRPEYPPAPTDEVRG